MGVDSGSDLDVIMVGPWMLGGNGKGLSGRYHGWPVDAHRKSAKEQKQQQKHGE